MNCRAVPHQQWRYESGQFVVRVDARCLNAQAFDTSRPLAQARTWNCHGGPVQRWRVLPLVATLPSLPPGAVPPPPPHPARETSKPARSLETVARDHRLRVDQARKVLEMFHFGSDRLRALEIMLPRLLDRANAFELLVAFQFERERAEARGLAGLRHHCPPPTPSTPLLP